ncbi:MAG: ABC transporter substrate-binding protein [Oscillospiraceae bacterium]|nr:ABC transporter substrate-binding protein [Oscillospiraceae bacterium]
MKKRIFSLVLAVVMVFSLVGVLAACTDDDPVPTPPPVDDNGDEPTPTPPPADDEDENGEEPVAPAQVFRPRVVGEAFEMPEMVTELPREETLIFGGLQWEQPQGWHPFHGQALNFAIDQVGHGSRTLVYETPFMYNVLTDELIPLLAYGPFEWSADMTYLTYRMNPNAVWSDGTQVTAHDAAFTWEAGFYTHGGNTLWLDFIEDVVALDDETVQVQAVMYGDVPVFARQVERFIYEVYVLQEAWLRDLLERNDFDADEIAADPGYDFVWSGPFTRFFGDETRNVLVRDDYHWSQHDSMWGTVPTPRYIVALILEGGNPAVTAALMVGDIDMSQHFISDVHLLWEEQGLPISTFMDQPPFNISANMPTAHFNMTIPMLRDHVELRRAIAWAVDYEAIIANAMTNQSPTFAQYPRSLFAPVPGEQALYNQAEVAHLQWTGGEVDRANDLLDETGLFPMGDDGWRTYNGERISIVASAPSGWTDWEASIEIIAAAGASIGIEITTLFPSEAEFYDFTAAAPPNPDSPGIFMFWTPSITRVGAWDRTRWLISSERLDEWPHNWNGANYSMFHNERANEIVRQIPLVTDDAELRALYTEAVYIYLYYVPSFSLMYRPAMFHTVNESVWTGFTEAGDGRNVPPLNGLSGYAVADLFNLRLVG